jgi:hypothetical protein
MRYQGNTGGVQKKPTCPTAGVPNLRRVCGSWGGSAQAAMEFSIFDNLTLRICLFSVPPCLCGEIWFSTGKPEAPRAAAEC